MSHEFERMTVLITVVFILVVLFGIALALLNIQSISDLIDLEGRLNAVFFNKLYVISVYFNDSIEQVIHLWFTLGMVLGVSLGIIASFIKHHIKMARTEKHEEGREV